MNKREITALLIIFVSFIVGVYFYPKMPDLMASHWDINGRINGYIPRFWGVFIFPLISFVLFLLFTTIPRIDPLSNNIKKFRGHFDTFIILFLSFLFYVFLLTILWNLGLTFEFDIVKFMIPGFAVILFYVGILMENSKRNWSIGIRTPWTLSSDKIWEKTHKLGGKLFKITSIISLIGVFFDGLAIYSLIVPLFAAIAYTVTYSYFEYRKLARR